MDINTYSHAYLYKFGRLECISSVRYILQHITNFVLLEIQIVNGIWDGMGCAGHDCCLFVLEFISQLEAKDKEEEDRQKERKILHRKYQIYSFFNRKGITARQQLW